jgi:uncharacterized membrane protein
MMRGIGALALGLIAAIVTFALIFGLGLAWDVYRYPHDGQAGMGWFLVAIIAAPIVGVITFAITLNWHRKQ